MIALALVIALGIMLAVAGIHIIRGLFSPAGALVLLLLGILVYAVSASNDSDSSTDSASATSAPAQSVDTTSSEYEGLEVVYGPFDGHNVPMAQLLYGKGLFGPMDQADLSAKQLQCGAGSQETVARIDGALPGIEDGLMARFKTTEAEAVSETQIIYQLNQKIVQGEGCSMADVSVGPVAMRATQYPYVPVPSP